MAVIQVANPKGGQGKSAHAFNLAVRATKDYTKVLLVDTDIQQSQATYLKQRELKGIRTPRLKTVSLFGLPPSKMGPQLEHLLGGFDIVIIDGGARYSDEYVVTFQLADLVMMPVRPAWGDLDALKQVIPHRLPPKNRPRLPVYAYFNQVRQHIHLDPIGVFAGHLERAPGITLIEHAISYSVYWDRSALGEAVFEQPQVSRRAVEEFEALYGFVKKQNDLVNESKQHNYA